MLSVLIFHITCSCWPRELTKLAISFQSEEVKINRVSRESLALLLTKFSTLKEPSCPANTIKADSCPLQEFSHDSLLINISPFKEQTCKLSAERYNSC